MHRRVPTVSFTLEGHHPNDLAQGFARDNIFVWSGHNYAIEPVSRMGLMDKGGVLRVGLAHYNTEAEVDALLSSLTRQIKERMSMAFRLGIIGLGKIAQDQHLPVVAKNRDFELAAVVSSRGGYQDVPAFRTPAELFRSGLKLDAVSLCMPPEPALRHRARCAGCRPSRADGEAADAHGGRTRCDHRTCRSGRDASSSPPGTRNTMRPWTRRSGCFRARP